MKQTINLILPQQKINFGLLTFQRLVLLSILFAGTLILFNGALWLWHEKINHDIKGFKTELNRKKIVLSNLIKAEKDVMNSFNESLEKMTVENKKIIGQLDAYQSVSHDRDFAYHLFSVLLHLETQDIFIKQVRVYDNNEIEIIGEAASPAQLTKLLFEWRNKKIFKGKVLNMISLVEQSDQSWLFSLGTKE